MIDKLRHEIVTIKDSSGRINAKFIALERRLSNAQSTADKSADTIIPFWARSRDFNVRKKFAQVKCWTAIAATQPKEREKVQRRGWRRGICEQNLNRQFIARLCRFHPFEKTLPE